MRRVLRLICLASALFSASAALARITPQDYARTGVTAPPDAALPKERTVTDEQGHPRRLGEIVTGPTVLLFADYTCRTLCGPTVAFVAAALEQSGLRPVDQFRLLVVGLGERSTPTDAARMRHDHLGDDPPLGAATRFVTADAPTVEALTSALGYRYSYDAEADQYVHPAAAFVLRADGRVVRVLAGLGLSGTDMRMALVEAGEGRIGTLADEVRLICSAFDPAHGTYDLMVGRIMAATGIATMAALGSLIGILLLLGRRRTT